MLNDSEQKAFKLKLDLFTAPAGKTLTALWCAHLEVASGII
jgi:hypothetical protein